MIFAALKVLQALWGAAIVAGLLCGVISTLRVSLRPTSDDAMAVHPWK